MKDGQVKVRKWFVDIQREEDWINEQCQKGLALTRIGVGGATYTFAPCTPGQYIYRTEMVEHTGKKKGDYFDFLRGCGVEVIANQWWALGLTYQRRLASEGPFDIETDVGAKLNRLKRLDHTYRGCLLVYWLLLPFAAFLNIGVSMWVDGQNAIEAARAFFSNYMGITLSIAFLLGLLSTPLFMASRKGLRREMERLRSDGALFETIAAKGKRKLGNLSKSMILAVLVGVVVGIILGIWGR